MELAKTQALLARLYTDGGLRDRFLAAPVEIAQEFGIQPDQAVALAEGCGADAAAFARAPRQETQ